MASKRELIEPHSGDKRYVRRDDKGQFDEGSERGSVAGGGSTSPCEEHREAGARR